MADYVLHIFRHTHGKFSGTLINPLTAGDVCYCFGADSISEVKQALEENYPDDIITVVDGITGESLTGVY